MVAEAYGMLRVFTASHDATVRIWNFHTGGQTGQMDGMCVGGAECTKERKSLARLDVGREEGCEKGRRKEVKGKVRGDDKEMRVVRC